MASIIQIKDAQDLHGETVTVNLRIEDIQDAQIVYGVLNRNGFSLALRGAGVE